MIKIACLSFNDNVINNFNHELFNTYYVDKYSKINDAFYDVVIILNDEAKVDLISCLKHLKNREKMNIYLIDYQFNEEVVTEAFTKYNIKDYFTLPLNIEYIILKIINDYQNNKAIVNFKYQDLYIDFCASSVFVDEKEINLTRLEYKILKLLVENVNKPLSKQEIFEQVWNSSTDDYRTLVAHIKSLRKKLDKYKDNIATIHAVGYVFYE